MKRNRPHENVLLKRRVTRFKKSNKFILRYYLHTYSLNKSNFTFKKYYDIFFKIHYPFLKKINNLVFLNLNFKVLFKKIFLEQECFLYGNANKFIPNYLLDGIDQSFYKIDNKRFDKNKLNTLIGAPTSILKSNVFIYKDTNLSITVPSEEIGDFFFKDGLVSGYLCVDWGDFKNNFNFEFLFGINTLYFLEIYTLHKTVVLNLIK